MVPYFVPVPGRPRPWYGEHTHDENYKRLFAFSRMAEDLLRAFVHDDWVERIDFSSLHPHSAQYMGDDLRQRIGDAVWRVRFRDRWLHVVILLEFQSHDDPQMALRVRGAAGAGRGEAAAGEDVGGCDDDVGRTGGGVARTVAA